jgi:hypothetical protein
MNHPIAVHHPLRLVCLRSHHLQVLRTVLYSHESSILVPNHNASIMDVMGGNFPHSAIYYDISARNQEPQAKVIVQDVTLSLHALRP